MTTISHSTTLGITLRSPSYTNPIVIDPGVTITDDQGNSPVYGSAGSWTIQNDGTLSASISYPGIDLRGGGWVTNAASASITGGVWIGYAGFGFVSGAGTVVNSGHIAGYVGVYLFSGGSVTNAASASIEATRYGVQCPGLGGAVTVVNSGSIAGTADDGVGLDRGGSVTNAASGSITGGEDGVLIINGTDTVVNSGIIAGTAGYGVYLYTGGLITNAASASITGHAGVYLRAGGTVTNAGKITGTGGTAIDFVGTASNRVVVDPGAVFNGKVIGSTSASNALELASGGNTGTLAGLGMSFTNFKTVTVDPAASWKLTGANTVAAASYLTDDGTLTNAGSLSGGVILGNGAVLTNASGAAITTGQFAAVYGKGATGTVVNSGSVATTDANGTGVYFLFGGSVTNAASASITGGVYVLGGAATVVNSGSITDTVRYGAELNEGGSITNAASASITGHGGVALFSGGTVTNAGTITGTGGAAVDFFGTASNRLVVHPGAVFNGKVIGSTSATNTLELTSGAGTGTLAGLGTSFTNFKSVTVDGGASWELAAANATNGVTVSSGGVLTNAGGTITSSGIAVYGSGGAVTVVNSGSIGGAGLAGVDLNAGGSVTNAASASIMGGGASVFFNSTGTVVNSGSITGTGAGGIGVDLHDGGSITNAAAASITGKFGINGFTGTVINAGTIAGTADYGIEFQSGGSITNLTSASISGALGGIFSFSGATMTNAGAITGGGGTAVWFFGTANNRLVVDPGAVFNGKVSGSTSASNALELASGGGIGTLTGLATNFTNFGTVTVDSGASWELTGANAVSAGSSLTDDGTLTNAGSISGEVTVGNGGTLTNAAGGTITNSGTAVYGVGGAGPVVNSGSIAGTGTAGTGVLLSGGGSVTNAAAASITGGIDGIEIINSNGTVVNSGTIAGTGANSDGVRLLFGGSVTNAASASITGGYGIAIFVGAGTVVNSGTIVGSAYGGVGLGSGSVTNAASASITGVRYGVALDGAGTVINSGTITATGRFGVLLAAVGSVTNAASASISAGYGIRLTAGGTVTNAGTITGRYDPAVYFNGIGSNRLVVDPGAVFSGVVAGSTSGSNALELASGGGTGSLGGLGTSFTNFGSVTVDSGASWQLTGANTVASAGTVVNSGTLALSGATLTDAGSLVNDGAIVLDPSTLTVANMSGSGSVAISSGSILNVGSGLADNVTVSGGGTLVVSSGATASGTVVSSGGTVDMLDGGILAGAVANDGTVNYDIAGSATFSGTLTGAGTLVVSGGGALKVVSAYTGAAQIDDTSTLEFTNTYMGAATFSGSPTGSGGTLKLDAPSTGPILVVNPNDTVIAQPGGNNWINAVVSYTLPTNIDALFLYAGAQGTGNSDASGDALYALDAGNAQTLTGNSANDTFVVDNSSDVVVPKAGSHDLVYAAASYTLPTGVDTLILEGTATQGVGNSDAAGDGLYAANASQVATLTGNSPNDTFVVYNSSDVVVPKAGSHDVVYSAVSYTLPTGVDVLILEGTASQGVGNSDAAGDALYAANPSQVATLTGNSPNDTFVVYNSADVVVPKTGSHDIVYSAVNYTLPTGVDSLILEAGTQAVGNSDAAGDTLYAANAGIAQTLTGNSHNDTFAVYNSGDIVVGQAGSTDTIYAAVSFTLPTNVDTLFLEGPSATHATGNSDAVNALYGNGGVASTLVAGSGADILYVTGTAGTILTGGAGHDTFAFPNLMGKDEVTNFGLAKDTLQFNATLFSNFTAAMNAASQVGANTVFTIDANDTVTLDNVTKTSLTASNFHFS